MAKLEFTFETGIVPLSEIVEAFASAYGYTATVVDPLNPLLTIPNPQSKAQFVGEQIKRYIRDIYVSEKRRVEVAKIAKFNLELT